MSRMAPEDRVAISWAVAAGAAGLVVLSLMSGGCAKKKVDTKPIAKATPTATPAALPAPAPAELLGTVRFEFDRSELTEEAKTALRGIADRFDEPVYARIEGHADERGSTEYNLVLSEKRAAAVLRFLSDLGVPAGRLSTVAFGEEKLVDPALTPEAHAKNRRAEVRVVPREKVSKN